MRSASRFKPASQDTGVFDAAAITPHVSWGTNPAQVVPLDGSIPSPDDFADATERDSAARALEYMGLAAGTPVRDVAVDMVEIAKHGLKNRARFSGGMVDERGYLSELEDIADSGITPADRLLSLYHGDWQGDVSRIYRDFAY